MFYLALSLSLLWFQPDLPPDPCTLRAVECYSESREYVLEEVRKAGLDSAFADRLIKCESGWRQNAVGYNKNGSVDKSYWQINSIHGLSEECLDSVPCSTAWAIAKVKRDGGFGAWSCAKKVKNPSK